MKRALLLLLLLLAGNTVFAQDYAPLPDIGIRRYFTNSAGYLRGIRVDSVVQEAGYKRYVTFRTPRGWKAGANNNELDDPNGACWVGKNVRAYPNGDWHFPNVAGDTILVKTGANVGDSWPFYRDTSSMWTEAKVLAVDTLTVFGVLDSVKRIGLTVKNGNVALSSNPISSFQVVLSKTIGFAQVPDLYLFPYKDLGLPYNERDYWYRKIKLSGNNLISERLLFRPITGWNLPEREMYNFNVGDVIFNSSNANYSPYSEGILDTVTMRQDFPTHTDYIYNRWYWWRGANQYGPTLSVNHRTSTARFTDKLLFDTVYMPEEYYGGCYTTFYVLPNDSNFCSKGLFIEQTVGDGCRLYVGGLQYPKRYEYKRGLGRVYYAEGDGDGRYRRHNLSSYQKNGVVCETIPTVPSSVGNLLLEPLNLKIYPQPATTEIFLNAPGLRYPATVRIQNLQGQLLSTQELLSAGNSISTATLPAGLYLLSVSNAGGNSAPQKLVVAP